VASALSYWPRPFGIGARCQNFGLNLGSRPSVLSRTRAFGLGEHHCLLELSLPERASLQVCCCCWLAGAFLALKVGTGLFLGPTNVGDKT